MDARWLLLNCFFISPVFALQTLGVVGPVVPAKPYYEKFLSKRPTDDSIQINVNELQRAKKWAGDYGYESGLTSGSFKSYPLKPDATKRLYQPLCLVANDQRSKSWLRKIRDVLIEVNAVCYLVNSSSDGEVEDLRREVTGIRFFALDPTLIITKFNVPHYPALISKSGVEQ